MRVMVRSIEMSPDKAGPIAAGRLLTVLIANVADAQLMSTCTESSPERRGELGCSIIESKLLPADSESRCSGTSIASIHWRVRAQP